MSANDIYTLSLHDALPILRAGGESEEAGREEREGAHRRGQGEAEHDRLCLVRQRQLAAPGGRPLLQHEGAHQVLRADRKSTRLNSSHANISYAVFCLKKKK